MSLLKGRKARFIPIDGNRKNVPIQHPLKKVFKIQFSEIRYTLKGVAKSVRTVPYC